MRLEYFLKLRYLEIDERQWMTGLKENRNYKERLLAFLGIFV
jgi:hypothetical protein